jgi:hypothetical protein
MPLLTLYAVLFSLGSFLLQKFANMTKKSLKELTKLKWCDEKEFEKKILQLAVSTTQLLVPVLCNNTSLKIKIVTKKEYDSLCTRFHMKPYVTNTHGYLFAEHENRSCDPTTGVMVSCWAKHPLVMGREMCQRHVQA